MISWQFILWGAGLVAMAAPALAQPLVLPGAQPPSSVGMPQRGGPPAAGRAAPRTVPEEAVVGRALQRNGSQGQLVVERLGKGALAARITMLGMTMSRPDEACAIEMGGDAPVPLTSLGRPAGSARYALAAPACPLVLEVLDGAVNVLGPAEGCAFQLADCRVDPHGLWGPEGTELAGRLKDIEQERGRAERGLHDTLRSLMARLQGTELNALAAEQAGFSSEREMVCRDYAGESTHGFCAARLTEARAADLAARLAALPPARPAKPATARPKAPALRPAQ